MNGTVWKIDANKDKTIVVGFNLIFKYLFPFRVLLLCLLKFVFDPALIIFLYNRFRVLGGNFVSVLEESEHDLW